MQIFQPIGIGDSRQYRVLRCLNLHMIRVDSDNKRLAACTKMALTQCRKVN
jgi:hypothetical protein